MMAHQLIVDGDACTACGTCVDVCFVNAIGWDDELDQPKMTYPDDCQVCCVCERGCPESAIEIVPDWAGRPRRPYLSAAAIEEAAR
jgi:MinD superfamily P-loop ATPase